MRAGRGIPRLSIATKNEPFSHSSSEFPRGNSLTLLEPVVFSSKRIKFVCALAFTLQHFSAKGGNDLWRNELGQHLGTTQRDNLLDQRT